MERLAGQVGCHLVAGLPLETRGREENPEYKGIGQNLFMARQEGPMNLTYAIQRWYGEKGYFTYETASCDVEVQSCGHYMQVVWAITTHVGCAYQSCHPLNESGFTGPAKFLVCNYSPADIYVGDKPYSKGAACSKCPSGAGWCSKKLCNNKCSTRGDDCPWSSCAVICYNCATIDQQKCRCSCADGWHGHDCTVRCEENPQCDTHKTWRPEWCEVNEIEYVRFWCPVTCKLCKRDPDAERDKCPQVYGPGAYFSTATSLIGVHQVSLVSAMVVVSLTGSMAL